MNLITLKTFDSSIKAHLLRTKLESEGIPAYVLDENVVWLNPLFSNGIGGIKVSIDEEDLEASKKILAQVENTPLTNEKGEVIKCPNCGAQDFITGFNSIKSIAGMLSMLTSFILMIFPIYVEYIYKCKDCDKEFKQ